jgi:GNAT superfamily N-acetyltransferase
MATRVVPLAPTHQVHRLAIREDLKGQGHGEYLLFHAIDRVARVAGEVGGYAVFVDAKDEKAAAFYQKYGFTAFPDDPLTLCLPFAAIPK